MEFVQDGTRDYSEDVEEDEEVVTTSNFFPSSSSTSASTPCYSQYPWLHDSSSSRSANYQPQSQSQSMELSLGSSRDEASEEVSVEREHMFDKVVTPSDVGKLNRLVIPKQHAEKYFPLDSSTNDKGLLLNFEDRNGKPWRFRYSYWNSSQSYVMTKGWSRFVKEKKLDAGDIVSFQRGVGDHAKDRLFIDWRRRPQTPLPLHHYPNSLRWGAARLYSLPQPLMAAPPPPPPHLSYTYNYNYNNHYSNNYHNVHHPYHRQLGYSHQPPHHEPVYYLRSSSSSPRDQYGSLAAMQQSGVPMVIDSVPLLHGRSTAAAAAGKKLRLFGVNMECETANDDGDESERMVLPSTALLPHVSVSSATEAAVSMSPQFSDKGKSSLSFDLDL